MAVDEFPCPVRNDEAIVRCSLVLLLGVQNPHKTTHDRDENRCFSTILLLQGLCAELAYPELMLCLAIRSTVTMTMRMCLFEVVSAMIDVSRLRGVQTETTTNHGWCETVCFSTTGMPLWTLCSKTGNTRCHVLRCGRNNNDSDNENVPVRSCVSNTLCFSPSLTSNRCDD
jgi:hypothetical protein